MTDTKSEAREFILVKEKLSNAALAFDLGSFIPQNWPPSSYVDTIHVIEKSAYAYAVDQWDYWVEEARKAQAKHERVLQMLEVAKEAIKIKLTMGCDCSSSTGELQTKGPDCVCHLHKALAQIESLK